MPVEVQKGIDQKMQCAQGSTLDNLSNADLRGGVGGSAGAQRQSRGQLCGRRAQCRYPPIELGQLLEEFLEGFGPPDGIALRVVDAVLCDPVADLISFHILRDGVPVSYT